MGEGARSADEPPAGTGCTDATKKVRRRVPGRGSSLITRATIASTVVSSTDTVTTAKPSPAAAYDAMAGPPFGTRSWTTQVHQLSGTGRPVPCERSKTRATDWAEPGHTSTVQASNSSWQIISQCTSTALPIQPVTRPFMKTSVGRSDGRSVACPGAAGLGPSGPAKFRVAVRSRHVTLPGASGGRVPAWPRHGVAGPHVRDRAGRGGAQLTRAAHRAYTPRGGQ